MNGKHDSNILPNKRRTKVIKYSLTNAWYNRVSSMDAAKIQRKIHNGISVFFICAYLIVPHNLFNMLGTNSSNICTNHC